MNLELVDKIINAVLYEGYLLYPYRPSAVKNQQRWNFGVLYPRAYSAANPATESSSMQTECLVVCQESAALEVRIRFLQLLERQILKVPEDGTLDDCAPVASLEVDGKLFQTWQEAVEREVVLSSLPIRALESNGRSLDFIFEATRETELLRDNSGHSVGVIERALETVNGSLRLTITRSSDALVKLTISISNGAEIVGAFDRDQALSKSMISTHTIIGVTGGEFVSQLDPPQDFSTLAASCRNIGTWPVLVGFDDEKDTMLSSPIILYDYPQIAPESAGNLFDGTEIDEILTLRIMTLTDEEKREMRGADERARLILERTESLPVEQFMKMHGAVRGLKKVSRPDGQ